MLSVTSGSVLIETGPEFIEGRTKEQRGEISRMLSEIAGSILTETGPGFS